MSTEPGTALTIVQRATLALGLSDIEQTLRELATKSTSIVSLKNPAGYDQCHAARMTLKNQRVDIQRRGKEARDDATKFSKAVIAEEKRLIDLIEPEEKRLQGLQDGWDAAREAEREAAIAAEQSRVAGIQARIVAIRDRVTRIASCTSQRVLGEANDLEQLPIDESFAEFAEAASDAKVATLVKLRELYAAALAREEEADRIIAEREELARLRAEHEKFAAAERARVAREEAESKAARDEEARRAREARAAEDAKLAAERKAEADRIAALRAKEEAELRARKVEQDRVEAEQKAARDAETAKLVAERAELARQQEALRVAQHPKVAPVQAAPPDLDEMLEVLAEHYHVPSKTIEKWLAPYDFSQAA